MTQNFNNAKIYKIANDYNDEVYVGSTCDTLIKRFSSHKKDRKYDVNKNRPFYKLMNEIGVERFRIDLIEDYPCNDKQALRQREGHFIREMGTLNICIAGRNMKSYYEDNKEKNYEKMRVYQTEYRQEKKDEVNRKQREYRKKNAEKIKEQRKEYYQRKKLEKENLNLAI